jgi:DNA-binding transcriptional MerR regulator
VSNQAGKYRINAVAEMTGIPAATLRAWERRYGLPDPGRTESSYRLYSEYDIAMVRRVRQLCDGGMAPSEAARVVLEEVALTPAPANHSDPYQQVRDGIVHAITAFDPVQAQNAIRHAMALGPATAVFDRVFAPAMQEIGDRWHEGVVTIGQEHLATQLLSDAASAMLRLVERDDADRAAVLACFADETHVFPSHGVALHLAGWGYKVTRLGARTPPAAIRQAVEQLSPEFVGLSLTLPPPAHRARELLEEYANACGDTPWIVGGAGVAEIAPLITAQGGIALEGNQMETMKAVLEDLRPPQRKAAKAAKAARR